MERPMTTAEYFDMVCKILEEKGRMPNDILYYRLAAYHPVPMRTYEFAIRNNLDYGGSEGIYLDLAVEFEENGTDKYEKLGTFKTLRTDREAMRTMAVLLADFVAEGVDYANANLDDFTWVGYEVYGIKDDGTRNTWCYSCCDNEHALRRKDELLQTYPCVCVRDNETRIETIYHAMEQKNAEGKEEYGNGM